MGDKSGKVASRSRAPNFSKEEQLLLFSSMEAYTHIIECKKTDSTKQIDKQNAWAKVAEVFNANTKGVPRAIDNLISCYRNVKSKLKKHNSESKMMLNDTTKREALVEALDENGKDWEKVGLTLNAPPEVCQKSFLQLKKQSLKDENKFKKHILGTGGGPPPSNEDPLNRIKKFIEPQLDGMFTMYDGDAELMRQFQKTKPLDEQLQPIEISFIDFKNKENVVVPSTSNTAVSGIVTPTLPKRTDFLRKKRASELEIDHECPSTSKKKRTVNDNFNELAVEKISLVKLQKEMLEMEIEHKKKLHALQLENAINENKFRIEMHEKELALLNIKIKKELN